MRSAFIKLLSKVKRSTSSLPTSQGVMTGKRKKKRQRCWFTTALSSSSVVISNKETLHQRLQTTERSVNGRQKAATTKAKSEPADSILQRRRQDRKEEERSFAMRTRKRWEEISTTLQKGPFTQDFRWAEGPETDPRSAACLRSLLERHESEAATDQHVCFVQPRPVTRGRVCFY